MTGAGTVASDGVPTSGVVEVKPSSAAERISQSRSVEYRIFQCPVNCRPVEDRAFRYP